MTAQAGGPSAALGGPWWVRLRAVLATGLVLGVGTTTTLAAWTDQVDVKARFGASTFAVQANTTTPFVDAEGSWSTYSDATAQLRFAVAADDMTPGSTRYASLALRTATGSLGGQALLTAHGAAQPGGLGGALRYRAITSLPCSAAAFGAAAGTDYVIGGPSSALPLITGQDPDEPLALAKATDTAPGASTHLCVEMSLPAGAANDLQGQQATARWIVDAISETT